ncbi:RagB/SusD family nutrient uptake outer membrane protein [Fulvivirga sp. M361]|uniref:RagB/SusD family nutrient uptake outer membrane protein n=1 Tax=Fulvivirga sp. M361 TaxID=2594266 RepID=UPI00117AC5D5|nr:RagB/SusD family nutrient uptake outer membrane protein [Fulvivirga sp. M361]TRX59048.1 RagB/SusD family nutrient uptake outer membrane protein [Fulvivirga sp. M361]
MKKTYKNIRFYRTIGMVVFLNLVACNDDFLEKPESNDVTIDEIFSTRINAESFLWESYRTCMPVGFPYDWGRHNGLYASMLMAACDEGDVYDSWPSSNNHNTGNVSTTYTGEDNYDWHYKGIRNATIFMDNIDRVSEIPEDEKSRMKAEVKILRALPYHELIKRYGAVPLITSVLSTEDDILLPRNTYEECIDFIVQSCDEAAAILPDSYPASQTGRITKGVALALKARVLLYAASPLHNTNTPYMGEGREYTGYPSYDESRWQLAADASQALLNWAAGAGIQLVTESPDPQENYRNAIELTHNPEIILSSQSEGWWNSDWPMFQQFAMPRGIYGGWYGHGVTLEHAQKYYTQSGGDQIWPDSGPGSEYLSKMQEMEPRFQYSVLYSGGVWNDEIGVVNFFRTNGGTWSSNAPVNGVGFMRKFLVKGNWGGGQYNWIVFRLAEFYLNYAESLNEVSPLDPRAFNAINTIRDRAGIPQLSSADPRYDTQEEFREAIRRERAVELAFEEHRFFDVRRWVIAGQEGVMQGEMHGLNLYEQADGSFLYQKEPFETRVWNDRLYLYPIPQGEIDKGYLKQNPGW